MVAPEIVEIPVWGQPFAKAKLFRLSDDSTNLTFIQAVNTRQYAIDDFFGALRRAFPEQFRSGLSIQDRFVIDKAEALCELLKHRGSDSETLRVAQIQEAIEAIGVALELSRS
jgi:hypothetical protein